MTFGLSWLNRMLKSFYCTWYKKNLIFVLYHFEIIFIRLNVSIRKVNLLKVIFVIFFVSFSKLQRNSISFSKKVLQNDLILLQFSLFVTFSIIPEGKNNQIHTLLFDTIFGYKRKYSFRIFYDQAYFPDWNVKEICHQAKNISMYCNFSLNLLTMINASQG